MGVVFPNLRDMLLAPGQDTDSAGGVQMSMSMIVIQINLRVLLMFSYMSRLRIKKLKPIQLR